MSVVEVASGIYCNQNIVIQVPGIGISGLRVASDKLRRADDLPRAASQKCLAGHSRECLREPLRLQLGVPTHLIGIPAPLKIQIRVSLLVNYWCHGGRRFTA